MRDASLKLAWWLRRPALAVALTLSCSEGDEALRRAQLAEGCRINSDCVTPLVCVFERCHEQCRETRDCPTPQRCVLASEEHHVCQLPEAARCGASGDGECSGVQICAADGQCRDGCSRAEDCVGGQICATGRWCAEAAEVDGDGNLIVADGTGEGGAPGSGGAPGMGGISGSGGVSDSGGAGAGANGGCAPGSCPPEELWQEQHPDGYVVREAALTSTSVVLLRYPAGAYRGYELLGVPKEGGDAVTLHLDTDAGPGERGVGIAADAGYAYLPRLAAAWEIHRHSLDGASERALEVAARPEQLFANESELVWRDGTAVHLGSKDGGAPALLATGALQILALDDAHVFLRDGLELKRAPVEPGATPALLATGAGTEQSAATDGEYVYWADRSGGVVARFSASLVDPPEEPLLAGQARDLAVDGAHLYFVEPALPPKLKRMPKSGGAVEELVEMGQAGARLIGVDAAFAYYYRNDGSRSRLLRIAK